MYLLFSQEKLEGASGMGQCAEALANKPNDLSSMPGTPMVERKNCHSKVH